MMSEAGLAVLEPWVPGGEPTSPGPASHSCAEAEGPFHPHTHTVYQRLGEKGPAVPNAYSEQAVSPSRIIKWVVT